MSTYLVTGAAGFIASTVCEFLLAGGHTVVGISMGNHKPQGPTPSYASTKW